MNILSLVSVLPTILETKKEDVFKSVVVVETCENKILKTEPIAKKLPEIDNGGNQLTESLKNEIKDLNKKNEYLSTNIIETNSHLLSIYKRLRSLESESQKVEKLRKENVSLFQKLKRVEDENLGLQKKSEYFEFYSKTLSDELISMKQKIANFDNLEEELILIRNKLEQNRHFENAASDIKSLCRSIPLYTKSQHKRSEIQNQDSEEKFDSMIICYMLPSIITVAAIVMNMYLYLSTNKKFPI